MQSYKELFLKNLDTLRKDIDTYSNETDIWTLKGDIKNSPGTLVLHLCGNLKHNLGKILGGADYTRDRDAEFSQRNVSKTDLLKNIDETIEMITPVLENLKEEEINSAFPDAAMGEGQSIGSALVRLGWHLGYHMGQINYHRRLLTTGSN